MCVFWEDLGKSLEVSFWQLLWAFPIERPISYYESKSGNREYYALLSSGVLIWYSIYWQVW